MTARDRIVLMAVIVVAALGAGWMLVVSPERKKASSVSAEVTSAQAALSAAEGELSKARAAQSQYAAAYSSIVSLGKAVPADKEVPSLIFQLAHATQQRNVFFSSISSGSAAGAAAGPASAAEATAVAAGFTAMPFSFVFSGSFFDLEKLMGKLTGFTTRTAAGALKVNGRLLTIQSVNLTPASKSGADTDSNLTGTVTASAYVLPRDEATSGATAAGPAGASTPASTTGAPSSPTAPATVTVNP